MTRQSPFPRLRFGLGANRDYRRGATSAWLLQEWLLYLAGERGNEKPRLSEDTRRLLGERRIRDIEAQAQRLIDLQRVKP